MAAAGAQWRPAAGSVRRMEWHDAAAIERGCRRGVSRTMSDVWEQLLSSAVLGIERRAFATPPTEGALGDLIGQLDASDPERALLAAAAAVALFQRTGRLASIENTPPPPACEPDTLPACSPRAARHLALLLG